MHFRQVSCLGRHANAKQGLVKRSLRDQKKTSALIGGGIDD
jgi:hypothetical protein